MNKKYKIEKIVNDRWAVWFMDIENSKNKLGVWRIIDLYSGTRNTRFAFKWKPRENSKRPQFTDDQIITHTIKNFYRDNNIFLGNKYKNKQRG